MKTEILTVDEHQLDEEIISKAAEILKKGGTVAFPTETVYGLGANALEESAVRKIFEAKGRPSDNPLIVHVSSYNEILDLVRRTPQNLEILIKTFCPGPLTMILKKSQKVPLITTGGLDTVAVRIPNHKTALELIKKSGIPIAAPSANISGKPSPTCGKHVINDLDGRVDIIIDGGCCSIGVESTVIDLTQDVPVVLRPGAVTVEQLRNILGEVNVDKAIVANSQDIIARAPGMKYKHYSPNAELVVVEGEQEKMTSAINELAKRYTIDGKKVGIIATDETKTCYQIGHVLSVGSRENLNEICMNLFTVLRQFDSIDVEIILSESVESGGVGLAVMNRLYKAAGYNIVKL